jgi:hypothetical protein
LSELLLGGELLELLLDDEIFSVLLDGELLELLFDAELVDFFFFGVGRPSTGLLELLLGGELLDDDLPFPFDFFSFLF